MNNENNYRIPEGQPSTYIIPNVDGLEETLSSSKKETEETPLLSSIPEPPHPATEEKTDLDLLPPWELLNHIKKPSQARPSKSNPDVKDVPSPVTPKPIIEEPTQPLKKPVLKIIKPKNSPILNQIENKHPETRTVIPVEIPPSVILLLEETEADKKSIALFKMFVEDLPHLCSGRVTLSIQDDTICTWNYDEGVPFSFFRLIDGSLCCGVESSLVPEEESKKTWRPPQWLFPEPVSFFPLSEITPMFLNRLEQASQKAILTTTKMAL